MTAYEPLSLSRLKEDVFQTLRDWKKQTIDDDAELMEYLLLVRQERWEQDTVHRPTQWRRATNQVVTRAMDKLEIEDQAQAQVLDLRFKQKMPVVRVGFNMNVAEATVMRIQRSALDNLSRILMAQEEEERAQRTQEILSKILPSTYKQLVGSDEIQREVTEALQLYSDDWVVVIVGMGGIGKTAVADAVVRKIIDQFIYDDVIWVRIEHHAASKSEDKPQLTYEQIINHLGTHFFGSEDIGSFNDVEVNIRHRLNSFPHLVVVDNLENEADAAFLIDKLNDLANPTRFLLTSRSQPESETGFMAVSVEALNQIDAISLMRQYADDIEIEPVQQAKQGKLEAIFEIVGGNPHALKIVVSLLEMIPHQQLISSLKVSQAGGKIDALYRRIYFQAWQTLSEEARKLLKVMPLVSEAGGDANYLKMLAGMDDAVYWAAVQQLRRRSLLEVRGGLDEKQYGIHRLTETFVRHDIANWWVEGDEASSNGKADFPT